MPGMAQQRPALPVEPLHGGPRGRLATTLVQRWHGDGELRGQGRPLLWTDRLNGMLFRGQMNRPLNSSKPSKRVSVAAGCVFIMMFCGGRAPAMITNSIALPFYNTAEFTPEWIAPDSPAYARIHRVADFCFTNQSGAAITSQDIRGQIYVANFFFTACPGI